MTPKRQTNDPSPGKPQIDKFKEAAHELETNEDEAAFDRALKKVAKAKPENDKSGKDDR